MIKKIQSARNVGVFKSFEWPASLPDFSKRNLIYGWNYSGKTTISRIFRAIELGSSSGLPSGSRFTIPCDGGQVSEVNLGFGGKRAVRVFNIDFIESNLLWNGGASPLLIIGEKNIAYEIERKKLQSQLERVRSAHFSVSKKSQIISQSRDRELSELAAEIKNRLHMPVFNRSPHLAEILDVVTQCSEDNVLDERKIKELESVFNSEAKKSLPIISFEHKWASDIDSCYTLFGETASRSAIASLREDRAIEKWVEEGLSLNNKSKECAFCSSVITDERWDDLMSHFSDSVNRLTLRIDSIYNVIPSALAVTLPASSDLYEDLRDKYSELAFSVREIENRLQLRLFDFARELEKKKGRIEDSYFIVRRPIVKMACLLAKKIAGINSIVATHNERVSLGDGAKISAKKLLLNHLALSGYQHRNIVEKEIRSVWYERLAKKRELLVVEIEKRIRRIDLKIETDSIGAERVNSYLRSFFGSDRLEVRPSESKFKLFRDSRPATSISEGEKTAISFAYFMASLESDSVEIESTIVYLDDPISSLDSNHIFNVFSIIRSDLKNCLQLFVSTHHHEFFRTLKGDSFFKEWKEKKGGDRVASYFRIVRNGDSSAIEDLPIALRKYSSEYHLLFMTLYSYRRGGPVDAYLVPNVMRRILEAYTRFRFPNVAETLDHRIDRIFDNKIDSVRVYKLVNHLSHSDSFAAITEPPSDEEIMAVADLVLTRLSVFDAPHYEGMCSICEAQTA